MWKFNDFLGLGHLEASGFPYEKHWHWQSILLSKLNFVTLPTHCDTITLVPLLRFVTHCAEQINN